MILLCRDIIDYRRQKINKQSTFLYFKLYFERRFRGRKQILGEFLIERHYILKFLFSGNRLEIEEFDKAFEIVLYLQFHCKIKTKIYSKYSREWKCRREPLQKIWAVPLRRSVEHAVCKVKYDKYMYYKNKLNETSLVDQIHDFKSHNVFNNIY